jgi:glycolate oxidase iron-sulfur subunit
VQIESGMGDHDHPIPVVHTVELIDWATGGPRPNAMRSLTDAG